MMYCMNQSLHLLSDDNSIRLDNYWSIVTDAVEAGIDVLQLRFKHKNKKEFYTIAKTIRPYLKDNKVCFLINDHVDIALMVDADGVHLGQTDLPVDEARKLLGPSKIIGFSLSSIKEFEASQHRNINYFGVGPIFPSHTKRKEAMGLDALKTIAQASPLPCIAIGGITEKNAKETLTVGAQGIAVCQHITAASSPYAATQQLRQLL